MKKTGEDILDIPCKCYLCWKEITIWTSIVQWDRSQPKFKCNWICEIKRRQDKLKPIESLWIVFEWTGIIYSDNDKRINQKVNEIINRFNLMIE